MIEEAAELTLPRFVRMRYDPVRGRQVLLAPERVLFPCPTSVNILERLEKYGRQCRFGVLVDELAQDFEAPREIIAADVEKMLQGLIDQRFLEARVT